jgi:flagellar basal body-associated protein FliL
VFKFTRFIVLFMLVVLFALPTFAQDATPEVVPTLTATEVPPVVVVTPDIDGGVSASLISIIIVLIVVFGAVVVAGGVALYKSSPPSAQLLIDKVLEWSQVQADYLLDAAEARAEATPNTYDDNQIAELRKMVEALFADFQARKKAEADALTSLNPNAAPAQG